MDHPWYAQSAGYAWLRVLLLPLRALVALAGMVAFFPLALNIPGLTAPLLMQSFLIVAASIAVHILGFMAFCWDHHASVNALARWRLSRRNRRALIGAI